jgi:hypothetical protein
MGQFAADFQGTFNVQLSTFNFEVGHSIAGSFVKH